MTGEVHDNSLQVITVKCRASVITNADANMLVAKDIY